MASQTKYPWRATLRTVLQAVIALAVMTPALYTAVTNGDPAQAGGVAAVFLAVAAGITRVFQMPGVNAFLERFVPWLAPEPKASPVADPVASQTSERVYPDDTSGGSS